MDIRRKMNILVTGSAGYIGKNLCKYLIDKGHGVTQLDKKFYVEEEGPFKMYTDDYNSEDILQHSFKSKYKHIKGIVHLAAIAGIQECQDAPMDAITHNIQASNIIIDLAKELDVPMVFASSQAALFPENGVYAMTKAVTEMEMRRRLRRNTRILRFSNVYGGIGMLEDKTTVIANFMRQYLAGEALTVHGDGTQTRDFVHVDDICQAIELSIHPFPYSYSDTYDVGTGVETSVIGIANLFGTGVTFEPNRSVGVKSNVANIQNIKEMLKYEPTITVENFLEQFFIDNPKPL